MLDGFPRCQTTVFLTFYLLLFTFYFLLFTFVFLSRFNPRAQAVLLSRQRARGVRVVGTWRVHGLVEVENHLSGRLPRRSALGREGGRRSVEKTRRGVGFFLAREIAQHEPELRIIWFGERLER